MRFFSLGLGFAAGNFIYALEVSGDWSAAINHTFFQTAAIAACWIMTALAPAERGAVEKTGDGQ